MLAADEKIPRSLRWALPLTGCTVASYGIGVATMVSDMQQREKEKRAKQSGEAANAKASPRARHPVAPPDVV